MNNSIRAAADFALTADPAHSDGLDPGQRMLQREPAQEENWRRDRDAMLAEVRQRHRDDIVNACLKQPADRKGGPIWSGAWPVGMGNPSPTTTLELFDVSLRPRVEALHQAVNKIVSDYNRVETIFAREHGRVDSRLIDSLVAQSTELLRQNARINAENEALLRAGSKSGGRGSAEDAHLYGPTGSIADLAFALLYIQYLQGGGVSRLKASADRLLKAADERSWHRPSAMLDDSGALPRLVSPEAALYAMMLYYTASGDFASSGRSAAILLYKRASLSSKLIYYPVEGLTLDPSRSPPTWETVFAAIAGNRYEPGWQCSHLFDVAADWTAILSSAADFNQNAEMRAKLLSWAGTLLKIAKSRPSPPPWASEVQQTVDRLHKKKG